MCIRGCCCNFSVRCRKGTLKHTSVHLIFFGCVITLVGVAMRIFLADWVFNFAYALIWAGLSAVVTGIGAWSVHKTMQITSEDSGFRGLILLSLVCIVCIGGAVGLITWQMREADYFTGFEDDSNSTLPYVEWFATILVYGFIDIASFFIIVAALIIIAISCCCPESSEIVKIV